MTSDVHGDAADDDVFTVFIRGFLQVCLQM